MLSRGFRQVIFKDTQVPCLYPDTDCQLSYMCEPKPSNSTSSLVLCKSRMKKILMLSAALQVVASVSIHVLLRKAILTAVGSMFHCTDPRMLSRSAPGKRMVSFVFVTQHGTVYPILLYSSLCPLA